MWGQSLILDIKKLSLILLVVAMPSVGLSASLFDGKTLSGWTTSGTASWHIGNGEIVGKIGRDGTDGWLVSEKSYHEYGLQFWFRCAKTCRIGILTGISSTGEEKTGTYVLLGEKEQGVDIITLDGDKHITSRQTLPPRKIIPSYPSSGLPPPRSFSAPKDHPLASLSIAPVFHEREWNHIEVRVVDQEFQAFLNGRQIRLGDGQPPSTDYGPMAIHFSGAANAELRIRDAALTDFTKLSMDDGWLSPDFDMIHPHGLFFGQGEAVADFNRDGHPDMAAGGIILWGPDFHKGHVFKSTRPRDPTSYVVGQELGHLVADFTGDGWPDIWMTTWPAGSPGVLYVNPQNKSRLWESHVVIPNVDGEFYTLVDLQQTGKAGVLFAVDGILSVATPDPNDPLKPWQIKALTEEGPWGRRNAHGIGVGDINGDGRPDILSAWGWWEQPEQSQTGPWAFHPEAFGRGAPANPGGALMHVYDVNGDGLADVVTSLEGHGRGLAWFEQKRDKQGRITFVQHMIMDLDPRQSHNVTFSEMHTLELVDMDGDGLKDIVTGKNATNVMHVNMFNYVDADADHVLYWFKLVRKANGQVEFIPKLIHNKSAIGRQVQVQDLNGDGKPDIAINSRKGVYIFYNKMGSAN